MSGVYISGMEMPKNCCYCPCMHWEATQDAMCYAVEDDGNGSSLIAENVSDRDLADITGKIKTPSWCPLVPVPPHGRLIDADALVNELVHSKFFSMSDYNNFVCLALKAPTIIPADPEKEATNV